MSRLVLLLGLALAITQGLTSGQFNQLLQAIGLQPSNTPRPSAGNPGLPPLGNGPTLPGNINTIPIITGGLGLGKPQPTPGGGGGGVIPPNFQP